MFRSSGLQDSLFVAVSSRAAVDPSEDWKPLAPMLPKIGTPDSSSAGLEAPKEELLELLNDALVAPAPSC
jgi:hypothetical protein